jgi:CBS domain-containing protein
LEGRGFTSVDFSVLHPGGKLGAMLKYARDLMHSGDAVPLKPLGTRMSDALVEMSSKGFGCVGIVDARGAIVGIVTDGDLRRHMRPDLMTALVDIARPARQRSAGNSQFIEDHGPDRDRRQQAGRHRAPARHFARRRGVGALPSTVIASEAKQSRGPQGKNGLLRCARNDDYLGNLAAFVSSGRSSPFARYDTVR